MEEVKSVVLYIGAFELPDKNAAAHRVIGNSKVLEKIGYEVYLAGFTKKNDSSDFQTYKTSSIKYFNINRPNTILNWISLVLSLNDVIRKVGKPVNTIIAYDFPSIGLIFLWIISKFKGIRLIGDCTEWYDLESKNIVGLIKKMDVALRMHVINKYLPGLIVISDFLNNYYANSKTNVINIPPLVDLTDPMWSPESAFNNSIVITYAGIPFSLTDNNIKDRVDLVLPALNHLKGKGFSFNFKIIGCDINMFLKRFPNLKSEVENLEQNICFLGKCSHNKVLSELKQSDFSIFVRDEKRSTKSGFPTKYVEAVSCGVPVITNTNNNLNKYLVDNYNGFFIDISSTDSIVSSLERILSLDRSNITRIKKNVTSARNFHYTNYIYEFNKIF